MKKKLTLVIVFLSLSFIFGYSVYSNNCPPSWIKISDTGFTCNQTTRDVTWRITWTDGNNETQSNFAHGNCLVGYFSTTTCPPIFEEPVTFPTSYNGRLQEEWSETAYDRRANGYDCENDTNPSFRRVATTHACATTGGGEVSYCSDPPPTYRCDLDVPETNCPYNTDNLFCNVSPILIDVTGDGFNLTDAANGVAFDIANHGDKQQVS